jgi:ankyrin repeat protein
MEQDRPILSGVFDGFPPLKDNLPIIEETNEGDAAIGCICPPSVNYQEVKTKSNEIPANQEQPINEVRDEMLPSYETIAAAKDLYCGSTPPSSLESDYIDAETKIFKAIGDSDEEEVMALLPEVSKDITNHLGQSMLHVAIESAAFDLILKIAKSGADVNMHDGAGTTPLIYAIKRRSFAYRILITVGADVNQVDAYGRSALFYVANVTQANWIIGAGARLDITDKDGNTALHYQLLQGCPTAAGETVTRFRSCCGLTNDVGNNVLHIMATMGYLTLAMTLQRVVHGKARFDELAAAQNVKGETPLALAIRNKRVPLADFLFPFTPINERDFEGNSYLHMIAETNSAAHVTQLHRVFPALDVQNDNHETPIMICCKKNSRKVLRRLLKLGASLNNSDFNGLKPIHIAAAHNSIGAFQIIIKKGFDGGNVNEEDILGRTPLYYAIQEARKHHNFRLITMMLQKGADLDKKDFTGESISSLLSRSENAALKKTIDSIASRIKKREFIQDEFDSDEDDRENIKQFCELVNSTQIKSDTGLMTIDV